MYLRKIRKMKFYKLLDSKVYGYRKKFLCDHLPPLWATAALLIAMYARILCENINFLMRIYHIMV